MDSKVILCRSYNKTLEEKRAGINLLWEETLNNI